MLYFITENQDKLENASHVLDVYGIPFEGKNIPILEIQSDSQKEIVLHKAQQAFEKIRQPLVVKDDGWYITALRGFPGVYMKYVNQWFTADDFLNLLKPYSNREILFRESVCYIDKNQYKIFINDVKAEILQAPRGNGKPSMTIVSFRKDHKTMAECSNEGIEFMEGDTSVWHAFAKWYKES